MLNEDAIDWYKHFQNLETWVKPIAEYARIHGLNIRQLYSKRSDYKKSKKKRPNPTSKDETSKFIPITLTKQFPSGEISLKIFKNDITYELSGLTLLMAKELIPN